MKRILYILVGILLLIVGGYIYESLPYVCHYPTGEIKSITKDVFFYKPYPKDKIYYYKNGNILSKGKGMWARDIEKWEYYYDNGQLSMVRNYKEREIEGQDTREQIEATVKAKDYVWFENKKADQLIIGLYGEITYQKCWDEKGNEIKCSSKLWKEIVNKQHGPGSFSDCGKKIL